MRRSDLRSRAFPPAWLCQAAARSVPIVRVFTSARCWKSPLSVTPFLRVEARSVSPSRSVPCPPCPLCPCPPCPLLPVDPEHQLSDPAAGIERVAQIAVGREYPEVVELVEDVRVVRIAFGDRIEVDVVEDVQHFHPKLE